MREFPVTVAIAIAQRGIIAGKLNLLRSESFQSATKFVPFHSETASNTSSREDVYVTHGQMAATTPRGTLRV
jgi:hypothetical protein